MTPLSRAFLDSCPVERGFRMRGMEMTRVEVFVDAAFAFAVTMLVISFDAIPTDFAELVQAIQGIPAFIIAVSQLVWIWYTHNLWSRRFGLDDAWTVVLSTALLIVMLIYVYPMRILAEGLFSWLTDGYLYSSFRLHSYDELQMLFVFLGIGWIALCGVYVLMYHYAARLHDPLQLNAFELHETITRKWMWVGAAGVGAVTVVTALLLDGSWVPYAGFSYMLLAVWFPLIRALRTPPPPESYR